MMITFLMMIVKARAYPTNNECFFFPREYKCRIQWYQRKYIDYYDTNWHNDSKYEIALDFDTSFGVNLIVLSHRHVFRICLIRNIALRWFKKEQTYHSCFRRTLRSTALQHDDSISLLISWSILRPLDTPISRWRSWYPSRSSHVSLISNDSTSSDYHYVSTRRTRIKFTFASKQLQVFETSWRPTIDRFYESPPSWLPSCIVSDNERYISDFLLVLMKIWICQWNFHWRISNTRLDRMTCLHRRRSHQISQCGSCWDRSSTSPIQIAST